MTSPNPLPIETREVRVPCSPEQEDVFADFLFEGKQLGMQPDERSWIIAQVRKISVAKILGADLDLEKCQWVVTLGEPEPPKT